jgi:hypothetical protein
MSQLVSVAYRFSWARRRERGLKPERGAGSAVAAERSGAALTRAVESIGAPGLHFHDLRHTGNHFAAAMGAGIKDLMARMGHDSERAAMIYLHEARALAQRVATLLSLTLLSARVCGPDSIQVIAPPSASHAAQMAISPTLRTPRVPPSPATAHSAAWSISAKPATHEPAQPATRSQLRGRQPRSRTTPATSNGTDSSTHTTSAITPTSIITCGSPGH